MKKFFDRIDKINEKKSEDLLGEEVLLVIEGESNGKNEGELKKLKK